MTIGSRLYRLDKVGSTNEYAKQLVYDAPEGTVVLADQQTNGKGRFGKKWYSPEGGIWMSVILQPPKTSLVAIAVGIAVCETLHNYGIAAGIKWPNDILLNNKKIAGVLTEIVDNVVVVGIGINLNVTGFPVELRDVASSVSIETGKVLDKVIVFNYLCQQLDDSYTMLKKNHELVLLAKWRNYSILLGQEVIIEKGNETVSGKVLDIDRIGALVIIRSDSTIEHIPAGICHLRSRQ